MMRICPKLKQIKLICILGKLTGEILIEIENYLKENRSEIFGIDHQKMKVLIKFVDKTSIFDKCLKKYDYKNTVSKYMDVKIEFPLKLDNFN